MKKDAIDLISTQIAGEWAELKESIYILCKEITQNPVELCHQLIEQISIKEKQMRRLRNLELLLNSEHLNKYSVMQELLACLDFKHT